MVEGDNFVPQKNSQDESINKARIIKRSDFKQINIPYKESSICI